MREGEEEDKDEQNHGIRSQPMFGATAYSALMAGTKSKTERAVVRLMTAASLFPDPHSMPVVPSSGEYRKLRLRLDDVADQAALCAGEEARCSSGSSCCR